MVGGNGIVTEYSYNDAGCVTRIVRRDGSEVLSSLDVASSKGTTYFNDLLGTTVGAKSGNQYSAAALSAFGEDLAGNGKEESTHSSFSISHSPFFTGKPAVEGLGYAFLMRNYRASLGKWQTADPLGYPDGWNQLAYCGNGVTSVVDLWGCAAVSYYDTFDKLRMTLVALNSVDALDKETSRTIDTVGRKTCRFIGMYPVEVTVQDYGWRKIVPEETKVVEDYTLYRYERCDDVWTYNVNIVQEKIPNAGMYTFTVYEDALTAGGVVGLACGPLGIAITIGGAIENVVKKTMQCYIGQDEWIPVGLIFTRQRDQDGDFVISHRRSKTWME